MAILKLGDTKQVLYELIDGKQEKPHLVFLHEGLGCTEMWKEFPHMLCKETGCPGIVYDRLQGNMGTPMKLYVSVLTLSVRWHLCRQGERPTSQ